MTSINPPQSVVQDWALTLPLMQQAVLLSALRGPDGFAKNDPVKYIVRFLRGVVLNPAQPELVKEGRNDVFMITVPKFYEQTSDGCYFKVCAEEVLTNLDPYPLHYILHLTHAAEIIGYKYPRITEHRIHPIGYCWLWLYAELCRAFHMITEDEESLDRRLKF